LLLHLLHARHPWRADGAERAYRGSNSLLQLLHAAIHGGDVFTAFPDDAACEPAPPPRDTLNDGVRPPRRD
jgi:hypothetical protein